MNTQIDKKRQLFEEASQVQTKVMVGNILGQGIDIHLLGLHQAALQIDCAEALPLFQDDSFRQINHFALSTSQVAHFQASASFVIH